MDNMYLRSGKSFTQDGNFVNTARKHFHTEGCFRAGIIYTLHSSLFFLLLVQVVTKYAKGPCLFLYAVYYG